MIATRLGREARGIAVAVARRLPPPRAAAPLLARARLLLAGQTQAVWIVVVTGGFAIALSGMFHWMSWNSRQTVIADTYSSSSNRAR